MIIEKIGRMKEKSEYLQKLLEKVVILLYLLFILFLLIMSLSMGGGMLG